MLWYSITYLKGSLFMNKDELLKLYDMKLEEMNLTMMKD